MIVKSILQMLGFCASPTLKSIIHLNHTLCILADTLNWKEFEQTFIDSFPEMKHQKQSLRVIIGILYLKERFMISGQAFMTQWCRDPYWQYFCGLTHLQRHFPSNLSNLMA